MASAWLERTSLPSSFETPQTVAQTTDEAGVGREKKTKQQQPRQKLSCSKCRERKVKQSYELRKLRLENQRLKERLQASRQPATEEDGGQTYSPDRAAARGTPRLPPRPGHVRQRRFRTDRTDSLYFGSPGLANVINDVRPATEKG
ncbi:hypothetical protein LTR28_005039 [Elasticomyces elasticus]|nr:hypothetical protein LTR28_005039 [Elasticomyces elasticus]